MTFSSVKQHLVDNRGWNGSHCCDWRKQPKDRTGWYLQQFLKLYAGRVIPRIRDYVIVDADVVFFSKWDVIVRTARPAVSPAVDAGVGSGMVAYRYTPSKGGCAKTYVEVLERLGLKRDTARLGRLMANLGRPCAVAHHMPISLGVARALHADFDRLAAASAVRRAADGAPPVWPGGGGGDGGGGDGGGYPWWRWVLDHVDTTVVSSFSEYVTYFAYARTFFPETIELREFGDRAYQDSKTLLIDCYDLETFRVSERDGAARARYRHRGC